MCSASSAFYLAFFALFASTKAQSHTSSAFKSVPSHACTIDSKALVADACTSYDSLDVLNSELSQPLTTITQQTDFFAFYRLNLYNKQCPYWSDSNSICGNRACAVDTLENEEDIPAIWRSEELSKLEGLHARHPGRQLQSERPRSRPLQGSLGEDVDESCVVEYDDECDQRDYCVPEDEGATAKGDYVSLVNNPEKFTGYAGPGARQVWDAIYSENCFSGPDSTSAPLGMSPLSGLGADKSLRGVMQGLQAAQPIMDEKIISSLDDNCLEQRAFYRIISGMHASISTHLCWDYFNQTTGQWIHNLECYRQRIHDHPERVSNLYFNYALVTRAVAKLQKHLEHYTFCSGDPDQDLDTKQKVLDLVGRIKTAPKAFDESLMFQGPALLELKEDFRNRFRNVSRLMECVGCDKCRLWGKLQTAGYGAALKILFEFDEDKNGENPYLRRTELVALVNTLARISHSLSAIHHFNSLIDAEASASHTPLQPSQLIPQHETEGERIYDDPDEDDSDSYYRSSRPAPSLLDDIRYEVRLVWRAYLYVLSSWISLPFKAWAILVMEVNRLWNFWLGLPVPPRSWDIYLPTREDLDL